MTFAMRILIGGAALFLLGAQIAQPSEPFYAMIPRGRNWMSVKLWEEGKAKEEKGDAVGARANFDKVIHSDPTFWPAFFSRARILFNQGKYQLAIKDSNEVLRLEPAVIPAAILRARANSGLGNYAASLKELDHVVGIRPPAQFLAWALEQRAWLRATCPDASIRNGKKGIDDAKRACSLTGWNDADTIDTLAVACAEAGDFDSAIRYEEKAAHARDANEMSQTLQEHAALFKQHRSIRTGSR
jgi:tetratricopeptide (TPR) repeat protein